MGVPSRQPGAGEGGGVGVKVWRGNGKEFPAHSADLAALAGSKYYHEREMRELGFELVDKEPKRVECDGFVTADGDDGSLYLLRKDLRPLAGLWVRVTVEEIRE